MPSSSATTDPATDTTPPTPTMSLYRPVLLRPNQPGAPHFDGTNVTEFLEEWEFFCDDYGCTDHLKCTRLPAYCDKDIGDNIKLLPGYVSENWATFCSGLKDLYWQHDKPKNTTAELNKLIKDAPTLDLNIYILKYTSITETLVAKGALSTLDRVNRLMDGLPEDLRKRVLKFCTKNSWRLSAQDTGTKDPIFEELRAFVAEEAQTRQKETVYDKERKIREGHDSPVSSDLPSPVHSGVSLDAPPLASIGLTKRPGLAASDPVAELTQQFSKLALLIEANMSPRSQPPQLLDPSSVATFPPQQRRPNRCHWCDDTEHMRGSCVELSKFIREGRVRINENNRVVNAGTGQEFPLMIGKGGMRRILEVAAGSQAPTLISSSVTKRAQVTAASVGNIMLETAPSYGSVGGGSVIVSTIDFENDTRTDEIVDVDVFEKRRRGGLGNDQSNKRVRSSDDSSGTFTGPSRQPYVEDIDDEGDLPAQPFHRPHLPSAPSSGSPLPSQPPHHLRSQGPIPFAPIPPAPTVAQPTPPVEDRTKKFRLASKLSEKVNVADVGEKVMDSPITLNLRELFAVSSEVSSFVNDQTRKHRLPIEPAVGITSVTASATSYFEASTNTTTAHHLYACPSSRAKVTLDGSLGLWGLIDHGSEVNLIPRRVYERMDNLPVDTDIEWTINAYHQSGKTPPNGMIGVIHALSIDVGGVEVKIPVFVVEEAFQDLILGRPWERAVRAILTNNNDGSVSVQIHSEDGRRAVRFTGVTGEHERNREFAKHAVSPRVSIDPLKV